ncbi:MAG: primase protein [Candidatus Giovannonibacteria bacterium GW2011_GWA2_53_7]|uniref:DNA primase n=1 Tax=Candidatus Giovannonibacteria bacterium GW2011_GWA2_53_7 TaxID=1618650 RepID=A0A0G2A794_9BACT|nr:MAG: primase protein [Candidatus Giovannonibacteria bacterium GW2011_GWA2_53_7]
MTSSPVEEIKQRLDLVEVIGEYITLRPAGKYHKALCPFHHEKTPSFMVDRENGIWHCFGCAKGGDVFSFVQELEGMEFVEALRLLAKKANVDLPRYDPSLQNQKTRLHECLALAASFYHQTLLKSTEAEAARQYIKERRISDDMVEQFLIGYSPNAWDGALKALQGRGYSAEEIYLAGLAIQKEKGAGHYDRFRNRLMFTIRDAHGTVVGFGGRVLPPAPEDAAKYINSPQSLVYNKSQVVYGLDQAKTAIKEAGFTIVVEGYMDLIASHQAGVKNVVASSGTAFTQDQLRLIKRYSPNLRICFDEDPAGASATRRSIDLALTEAMDVRVIRLSNAKDPDELIRTKPESWPQAVASAVRFMDDAFDRTLVKLDLKQVDDKKRAAAALLPIIARLPDGVEQTHYLQKLAEAIRVDEQVLRRQINRSAAPAGPAVESTPAEAKLDRRARLSEQALSILISCPELIREAASKLAADWLTESDQALYKLLRDHYSENHDSSEANFQASLRSMAGPLAEKISLLLLLAEREWPEASADELHSELRSINRYLEQLSLDQTLANLKADIRAAESAGDSARTNQLINHFHEVSKKRQLVSR